MVNDVWVKLVWAGIINSIEGMMLVWVAFCLGSLVNLGVIHILKRKFKGTNFPICPYWKGEFAVNCPVI